MGDVKIWFRKGLAPLPSCYKSGLPQGIEAECYGSVSKNAGFSDVLVEFMEVGDPMPVGSADGYDKRIGQLPNAAIEALAAFLRYYKINNLKHYLPRITAHGVAVFALFEQFDSGVTAPTIIYRLIENPIPFQNTIGIVEENKIREELLAGDRNYIHELFSEVWNKIALQDWRLVVIDSVVLLEAWLTPLLLSVRVLPST